MRREISHNTTHPPLHPLHHTTNPTDQRQSYTPPTNAMSRPALEAILALHSRVLATKKPGYIRVKALPLDAVPHIESVCSTLGLSVKEVSQGTYLVATDALGTVHHVDHSTLPHADSPATPTPLYWGPKGKTKRQIKRVLESPDFPLGAPKIPRRHTRFLCVEDWFGVGDENWRFFQKADVVSAETNRWTDRHQIQLAEAQGALVLVTSVVNKLLGQTYTPPTSIKPSTTRQLGGEQFNVRPEDKAQDRENATVLRKTFQHIRAVSTRLDVTKQLHATFLKMQGAGYVGFASYRIALQTLARLSRASTVNKYYEAMRRARIVPDEEMFHLILSVWAKRSLVRVAFFLQEMVALGMQLTPEITASVMHAIAWSKDLHASHCGPRARLDAMERIFRIAEDLHTGGGKGLCEEAFLPLLRFSGNYVEGLAVFERMLQTRGVNVSPKSLNAVLRLCVTLEDPSSAEDFVRRMDAAHFSLAAPQYRLLLQSYEAAERYSTLVNTFRDIEIQKSVPLTSQTFDCALRALARLVETDAAEIQRHINDAEIFFELAISEYGHEGAPNLWNAMLEVYVVAKDKGRGMAFLKRMKKNSLPANSRCRRLYKTLTGDEMSSWDTIGSITDDKTLAKYLTARYRPHSKNAEYTLRRYPKRIARYIKAIQRTVHRHVSEDPTRKGPFTLVTLIRLFSYAGKDGACEESYAELLALLKTGVPDAGTHQANGATALMSVYTQMGDYSRVRSIWRSVTNDTATRPTPLMCAQLLWGMTKGAAGFSAQEDLLREMAKADIPILENAAVAILSNAPSTTIFRHYLNKTVKEIHSAPILGAFLKVCAKEKNVEEALKEFKSFKEQREREYLNLFNVFKESGVVAGLQELYHELYEMKPDAESEGNRGIADTICILAVKNALETGHLKEASTTERHEALFFAEECLSNLGTSTSQATLHSVVLIHSYIAEKDAVKQTLKSLLDDVNERFGIKPSKNTLDYINSLDAVERKEGEEEEEEEKKKKKKKRKKKKMPASLRKKLLKRLSREKGTVRLLRKKAKRSKGGYKGKASSA